MRCGWLIKVLLWTAPFFHSRTCDTDYLDFEMDNLCVSEVQRLVSSVARNQMLPNQLAVSLPSGGYERGDA